MDNFCVEGAIAAPATAMLPNGDINTSAVGSYVNFLSTHDIDGVFILGTLGEGMSFTTEERKAMAAAWVSESKDRLKYVIVHIGAGNIRDSIELAKHADMIKASAIACMAPSYFKPENEEVAVEYLSEVAAAAPNTPFYYYCINFMTGVYLNTAKILELASKRIPNFRGVKMSSSELPDLMDCTTVCGGRLNIMIGTDEQFLTALSLEVAVPILNGYLGGLFKRLKTAFDKGDMKTALKEQHLARKMIKVGMKYGTGPAGVKAIMKCYGLDLGPVRLPLKNTEEAKLDSLRKDLKELGMLE